MAHAAYGAMYLIGAASAAGAVTTMVCSIAPSSRSFSTTWATVEPFWPMAQ